MQAATCGLIAAVRRFAPDRGVRLATFAYHHIRGQVIADVFGKKWRWYEVAIPAIASDREGRESDIPAPGSLDPVADTVAVWDLTRHLRERVTRFDVTVLAERYAGSGSNAEVARRLGVHPKRVSRAVMRLRAVGKEVIFAHAA
jgi:DNA-directed RNA polymerase specialized sigma subunit